MEPLYPGPSYLCHSSTVLICMLASYICANSSSFQTKQCPCSAPDTQLQHLQPSVHVSYTKIALQHPYSVYIGDGMLSRRNQESLTSAIQNQLLNLCSGIIGDGISYSCGVVLQSRIAPGTRSQSYHSSLAVNTYHGLCQALW